jgi:hypothetical protein
LHSPVTFPVAISRAANKVVVPLLTLRVGPLFGMAGLHRQVFWLRFNAWILDFSSSHNMMAFSVGLRYRPIISVPLASSSGSVENLNVAAFHGFTPYRFEAAATVTWLLPHRSEAVGYVARVGGRRVGAS